MSEAVNTRLGQGITQDGVRAVNFFNGRLLTARDLSRDQDARRLADARVGASTGSGIAWGLEVNALDGGENGEVQVEAGLAMSLSGQALNLATPVRLTLIQPPVSAPDTGSSARDFGPCKQLGNGSYVAGDGLFLLTLTPLDQPDGFAPVLAIDAANARCAQDLVIEAAQLRLIRLPDPTVGSGSERDIARMRNRLAYDCFGADDRQLHHLQPDLAASRPASQSGHGAGLLDRLLADKTLHRCDVPLALVYMLGRSVVFVDGASVRRRVASQAATQAWSAWLGERLQGLGEAQMLQFQEHCADTPAILQRPATDSLHWLPPAGLLPGSTDWARFFGSRKPAKVVPLSEADATAVLQHALLTDPIALTRSTDTSRLRVYRIGGEGNPNGPLLFVRDSRNGVHAEQVWLDGARTGLSGCDNVQLAVDRLRHGSCLHLVIHPNMTQDAVQKQLDAQHNQARVFISFEPGVYALSGALQLKNAGHVEIQGHGALLQNHSDEKVLLIQGCDSLVLHGLELHGGKSTSNETSLNLGGALTVLNTPSVRIQGLKARTQAHDELACNAITVRRTQVTDKDDPSDQLRVDIAHCELLIGARQGGILCVNAERAHVHDNLVRKAEAKQPLRRGIVVAGRRAGDIHVERNQVLGAVEGITVATSDEGKATEPALLADRVSVSHNQVEVELLSEHSKVNRCGVMLGNARSAWLAHNEVLADGKLAHELGLQGMRLHGVYGTQLVVRDNRLIGVDVGVRFDPIKPSEGFKRQMLWLFAANLGEQLGSDLLSMTDEVSKVVTRRDNLPD